MAFVQGCQQRGYFLGEEDKLLAEELVDIPAFSNDLRVVVHMIYSLQDTVAPDILPYLLGTGCSPVLTLPAAFTQHLHPTQFCLRHPAVQQAQDGGRLQLPLPAV